MNGWLATQRLARFPMHDRMVATLAMIAIWT
jgi:hypothetical protein